MLGFFLPVHVLSRLFRCLFLEGLAALHKAGRLAFLGDLAPLADKRAFDAPSRTNAARHGSAEYRSSERVRANDRRQPAILAKDSQGDVT